MLFLQFSSWSVSPGVIFCSWLGSKHQLSHELTLWSGLVCEQWKRHSLLIQWLVFRPATLNLRGWMCVRYQRWGSVTSKWRRPRLCFIIFTQSSHQTCVLSQQLSCWTCVLVRPLGHIACALLWPLCHRTCVLSWVLRHYTCGFCLFVFNHNHLVIPSTLSPVWLNHSVIAHACCHYHQSSRLWFIITTRSSHPFYHLIYHNHSIITPAFYHDHFAIISVSSWPLGYLTCVLS